jgi:N-methylhydantoinase A/oxoprolinase/acetone carboxylase beta subunit
MSNDASGEFMRMARYRLGVDVGGTHTDIVLADETTGSLIIEKVPSTPGNPARAVIAGLKRSARGASRQQRSSSSVTARRSRPTPCSKGPLV